MAPTVELLREGRYQRHYDTGQDGLLDTYRVTGLQVDTIDTYLSVVALVEGTAPATKYGLPRSVCEVKRFSSAGAFVNVIYGRIRGGGYFLPLTYSGGTTEERTFHIPIWYQDAASQWKLKWRQDTRIVTKLLWNTRVEDQFLATRKAELEARAGSLLDFAGKGLGGYGIMRLVDGGFKRLASNEVRGELVFEQPAPVKSFAVGDLENGILIPALLAGQQYKNIETGSTPAISVAGYTVQYNQMPDNAFSWMDFTK